jgi:hypothetical protein
MSDQQCQDNNKNAAIPSIVPAMGLKAGDKVFLTVVTIKHRHTASWRAFPTSGQSQLLWRSLQK